MTIHSSVVSNGFAILDSADETITAFDSVSTQTAAEYVLRKYSEPPRFTCEAHVEWGMKFSSRIITNIFYNNKQKTATDTVRMDVVSGFKSQKDLNDSLWNPDQITQVILSLYFVIIKDPIWFVLLPG